MNARELYRAGRLDEAVAAQTEEVKQHPADSARRCFLGELLCLAGNLERADAQFEAIGKLDTKASPMLALLRQLVRAEKARQEVHFEGRAPEFLSGPDEHQKLCLQALVALRTGDDAEAGRLLAAAEEQRYAPKGRCDGQDFDDLRDLDDVSSGSLEVLTSTGRYLWVPFGSVETLELDKPTQPLDLLWRPATLTVREGPDGKVFLPVVYADRGEGVDDAARLGRRTDWIPAGSGGAVRGRGLRTWLVGEESRTLLEIGRLELRAGAA
jgi:type VI secretion system protein ImpE